MLRLIEKKIIWRENIFKKYLDKLTLVILSKILENVTRFSFYRIIGEEIAIFYLEVSICERFTLNLFSNL